MSERPTLKTERLILRPFTLADAPDVQRLAGDRAIAETTLNIPHPYPAGGAEEWISTHQHAFDLGKGVHFAITRKADGGLVGAVSLMGMVRGHLAELGYWIGKPHWNQGFCTEAARAVVRYGFEELGLVRIHASFFKTNPASGRVMRKLGMRPEGCLRRHIKKWGRLDDLELYAVLKDEWE